jgi:hypothetical protein
MSRFERQVSWLPLVAPTAEFESSPIENNSGSDSVWQPKSFLTSSFLPTLPETPPSFVDDDYQHQISIDSIIDERNLNHFLSPPPPCQSILNKIILISSSLLFSNESIVTNSFKITFSITRKKFSSNITFTL